MDCSINGDHVRLSESDISVHCSEESQTIPSSFLSDSRYYRKHSYNRELNSQNKNSILGWGKSQTRPNIFPWYFTILGWTFPTFYIEFPTWNQYFGDKKKSQTRPNIFPWYFTILGWTFPTFYIELPTWNQYFGDKKKSQTRPNIFPWYFTILG